MCWICDVRARQLAADAMFEDEAACPRGDEMTACMPTVAMLPSPSLAPVAEACTNAEDTTGEECAP